MRSGSSTQPAAATPRPAPQAFEGMLRTGLPVWALLGIVALCGMGTVLVVRSAGHRPSRVRRQD